MRKLYLLLVILSGCITAARSQVSSYTFAASGGTYTAISGTVPAAFTTGAWDDGNSASIPLGFTFVFNGVSYTTVIINANGFISFGGTAPNTGFPYTPISDNTANAGVVAAWGRDIQAQSAATLGAVQYNTVSNVFTVQWSDARRYLSGANAERINMQIKLFGGTNVVRVIYGSWSNAISANTNPVGQVGLRGAMNTDFNNLSVLSGGSWAAPAAGTVNTATCFYNEANIATKPAIGQTYTWTPAPPVNDNCSGATVITPANNCVPVTGNTSYATQQLPASSCASTSANEVWYSFTANGISSYTISATTGTLGDLIVELYSGTCASPAFINCADLYITGTETIVTGVLAPGTYRYRVYGYNGATGSFTTCVTFPCTIAGTKVIGPAPSDYTSIASAITSIQTNGLGASVIFELKSNYVAEGALTFPQIPCASATQTITIRPQAASATIYNFTSAAATTWNFSGGDYYRIDGRPGGAGSAKNITLTNTSAAGITLQINNGAAENIFTYCNMYGMTSSNFAGVVNFGGAGPVGNLNNSINNCVISSSSGRPSNCIYSGGTAFSANQANTISNNAISNYYSTTGDANAILLASNSSAWTITGNTFSLPVQSVGSMPAGSAIRAIFIATGQGGYTVSSNNIHPEKPELFGGGGLDIRLYGIELLGSNTLSSIQGNNIYQGYMSTGSVVAGAGAFAGINITGGSVNVGTITGNVIRGESPPNGTNILGSSGYSANGIYCSSSGTVNIANNTITGLQFFGNSGSDSHSFSGIQTAGTGIYTITGNTIGGAAANSIQLGGVPYTTGQTKFYGIRNSSTGSAITISNNTISNCASNGLADASIINLIINEGACGTLTINQNTFTANNLSGGGGSNDNYNAVRNSGAVTGSVNINDNNFISGSASKAIFGGEVNLIYNFSGAAGCTLEVKNNTIAGFTYSGATGGTYRFYGIRNDPAIASSTYEGNIFTNLSLKLSGLVHLMHNSQPANALIQNNSISGGFQKTVAGSAFYAYDQGLSPNATTVIISNNNFSNISLTGNTACIAISLATDVNAMQQVNNNIISNVSTGAATLTGIEYGSGAAGSTLNNNTVTGLSGGGALRGLYVGFISFYAQSVTISGNTISDLNTTGATAKGIDVFVVNNAEIFKNKVYNISASNAAGLVKGIFVGFPAKGTFNIYNNLVGDLRAPLTTASYAVLGIEFESPSNPSNLNVYFNTVYLNASSSGTHFGTAAIYHAYNNLSNYGLLTMRNNNLVNTSTANGSGLTVAFERDNATNLNNFSPLSNNNNFYAGTPAANHLIYYNGNNADLTLTSYKARVAPRDNASVTDNPVFLSTVGTSASFLHIDPNSVSQLEFGGAPIAGITDDYDGDVRDVSYPDIGADEFTGNNIRVNATGGTLITFYPTLKAAFAQVNSGLHKGVITVTVLNSTKEQASAVLNASGAPSSYTSLTIQPSGTRTITGTIAGPLVDLNSADNVTINGLNTGGNSLSFVNLSTSAANHTCTIRFVNGATGNTLKNCTILGSAQSEYFGGTVYFGNFLGTGNNNNTVDLCNIGSSPGGAAINAVFSQSGSLTSANSANTISNNNIFDYFNANGNSAGVSLAPGLNTAWTITGNRLYQTTARTAASASVARAIYATGTHTISNNIIGYANAFGSGITDYNGGDIIFTGIYLQPVVGAAATISDNTITAISVAGTHTSTAGEGIFSGIIARGAALVTNNIIGSAAGNGSIVVTPSAVANVNGIYYNAGSANGEISYNTISSLNINSTSADVNFIGISQFSSAVANVHHNTIGSTTTANAVSVGSFGVTTAKTNVNAIYTSFIGSNVNINNNAVSHLSINGAATTSLSLIVNFSAVTSEADFIGNDISYVSFPSVTAPVYSYFLQNQGGGSTSIVKIQNNNIHDCLLMNTSDPMLLLYNEANVPATFIENNIINNISKAAGINGQIECIHLINSSTGNPNITVQNNFVSNVTTSGTGRLSGISFFPSSQAIMNCQNNGISNLTGGTFGATGILFNAGIVNCKNNNIQSVSSGGNTLGINVFAASGLLSDNMITGIHSVGGTEAVGIHASNCGNLSNLNVSDITNTNPTGFVYGIRVRPITIDVQLSNNVVGDLFSPNSNSSVSSVYGIYVNGSFTRLADLINNTVKITGTAAGNFSSSAFSFIGTGSLRLQNNILVNSSTPGGSGTAVAFTKSAAVTFAANSDRNILYAGTPANNHLIFSDNASAVDQTINRYRSRVGPATDNLSVTEDVSFLTAVPGTANYLHVTPGAVTFAEGRALPNAAVAADIDLQARSVTTPDVGADEFSGILKDGDAPVLTVGTSTDACNAAKTIVVTVTDATGIALSGAKIPRVYFTKNGGFYFSAPGTFISGSATNSTWQFIVDPAVFGAVNPTDVISYYFTAQDLILPQPNMGAAPAAGFYADDVNTVIARPTTPYSYTAGTVYSFNTWLGFTADWFTASNWCGGVVPVASTNVTIPDGATYYPVISSGTAMAANVNIAANASVLVSGTGIFELNGIVTNAGTFDLTDGTLSLANTSASIGGSSITNATVKQLQVNANATLAAGATNMLKVKNNLSFGNVNNKTFNTNNNLTLLSSATGTASFNDMTNNLANSGNSVFGDVVVERFIPAGRKWRLLSVPTATTQTIREAWMEGAANISQNPNAGYGTVVTDNAAGAVAAGFDAQSLSGPSVKYYVPGTNSYTGITSPSVSINGQRSYFNFVRGNRTSLPSNSTLTSTILRTTGPLKQNTLSLGVTAGTIEAVGNPYASRIDLRKLSLANMTNFVYLWDPQLTSPLGLGAFQVLSFDGADYRILPGGGNYGPANSVMNTIESGQGFFMKGGAGAGTVQFTEPAKTLGSSAVFFAPGQQQSMTALLSVKQTTDTILVDGARVDFKTTYSNAIDLEDADKLFNVNENVSVKAGNQLFSIERRNEIEGSDTIQFNLSGLRYGNYVWNFNAANMDAPGRAGFLIDKFLSTETVLSLDGENTYNFTVSTTAGTYAADRFMIVFRQASVVPVTIRDITAVRQKDESILVEWRAENEINVHHYETERSANGASFSSLANTLPTNNSGGNTLYNYVDAHPLTGDNFYRIKAMDNTGNTRYTRIVKVAPLLQQPYISVSPNPVKNKTMHVAVSNLPAGNYSFKLLAENGSEIMRKTIALPASIMGIDLPLHSRVASGTYLLLVLNEEGFNQTIKVIIL